MSEINIEQLNNSFSIVDGNHSLVFKVGQGSLPIIDIKNEQASATISLQGAYVLSWTPAGEDEVIWLSSDATFSKGKSIRGGIPICWPWFGAHETNSDFPAHGFARTVFWQVIDTQKLPSGETQITFQLDTMKLDEKYHVMWPQNTVVEYKLVIGRTLNLEITTFNHSDQPFTLGQALHTYFKVGDVRDTTVTGLDGKEYLDKTDDFNRKKQIGAVTINSEIDRVYLNTSDDVVIDDRKRKIHIKKEGSLSTVVWNPWKDVADKMGDLGKDGYLNMLCVESANAAEDTITILANQSHTLSVHYDVSKS